MNRNSVPADPLQSQATSKRLFFALWPDEQVIQNINQHAIKYFADCQGRMLKKSNWHITLAYFGATDNNTQICLQEKAEQVKSQPFEVNLSKCGFWPRPQVAWLAPEETPVALKELAHSLQHIIQPCGFKPETREYQPHITLVRKAKVAPAISDIAPINWQVTRFCMVESKTHAEGPEYQVLKSWDL